MMNILLIGSGGREHALAWKLAQSPRLSTALRRARQSRHRANAPSSSPSTSPIIRPSPPSAGRRASTSSWSGPRRRWLPASPTILRLSASPCSVPSQEAAQLEGSKGYTKALCAEAGIPTAAWAHSTTRERREPMRGRAARRWWSRPTGSPPARASPWRRRSTEALAAIDDCFAGLHGAAGASVVIEDFLEGEEASFFALADGDDGAAARHRAGPQAGA